MKKSIALCMAAALMSSAFAFGPAVVSITGGSAFGGFFANSDDVIGYGFTTGNEEFFVTALGFWIDADGATSDHMVGIWDMGSGVLVTSTNVEVASGFDQAGWHYNSVGAVLLNAGTRYVAGAMYNSADGDNYISSNPGLVMDPNLTHTGARFPVDPNLGFIMPTGVSAGNLGRHGPNFISTPVPEPASMAVLGLGLAALLRRRKKAA